MIGQTISHYKILEKLGEGGMGVVYKAEDTKLKRTVALKFLPKGLEAHEPERARFTQEAQAASALNHQNICAIHTLGEHEDQQFIDMEFVDGITLRQKIQSGQLSINDVIAYSLQIGEALQEAHAHGIVHRDVKPENIMVNTKNQIKVMDFGLAKLKGSMKLTRTSSTVGTLAYMAPEQIQGEAVDARSDIFSFGIVLFEMLTGRLPFRGEHEAAMMYSIVNEEPAPLQKFLPDVSPELIHIVGTALEKDPNDRYQSAADMVRDLRRVQKKSARVSRGLTVEIPAAASGQAMPETSATEKEVSKKPLKKIVWSGIGIVVLLGIIAVVYLLIPKHPSQISLNPDMIFRVLPIPFTEVGSPGLSQDGNWAVFPAADANSKWDLYFMNTTSGESRRITFDSSMSINNADISPDGSQIVYHRYNAPTDLLDLVIVSSVGGSSKRIVEGGWCPRWRPDGQRIGYLREKDGGSQSGKAEFWTIKPNGTDNRRELVDSVSSSSERFYWSPDGSSICWIRHFSQQCQELIVYHLSTGEARQLTFDNKEITDVCWVPNDQIIFSSNRSANFNLWMVPASGGSATQITKGAGPDHSMKISRDGSKLLYRQRQYISHIWIAGTDGSNPHQITFDDAYLWRVSFSLDGKEVLFGFSPPVGYQEGSFVCSIDRNGRNRKQLTSGEESINNPIASPDGRWIIYGKHSLSSPTDSSMVYLIDAQNPGTPKLVGKGVPIRWVDEKTFVSFNDSTQSTWLNNIEGGEPQKFFEDSTWAIPLQARKYIGYGDRRSGRHGLWICAAPGVKDPSLPSPRMLPTSDYGEFDKSGKFLYFVKNASELRRISIPSGKEEIIRGVFPGLNSSLSWLDISYDGKEIVYTDARFNSKLVMIENPFK
jgi:eukaryotic-like serine/threonine-protein kinase